MARRILNRRELRKTADQAEQQDASATPPEDAVATPKKGKAKAKAKPKTTTPKPKKPRKKKEPPRMCARWGVFDAGMRQVAIFNYNQRAEADQKIADLVAKKNAAYFLQIVKEPMPEPVEAEPAAK